jgi:hypothetical protein
VGVRRRFGLALAVLLAGGALRLGLAAAPALAADPVSITGVVAPAEEDDEGNVLSVQIETPGGPYRVREVGKGAELRQQLGITVTAQGHVSVDEAGARRIEVVEYQIAEE